MNNNICVLSNSINKTLLDKYNEYNIIDDNISFDELKEKIENYLNKVIVFNDVLRKFLKKEKQEIIDLLKIRSVKYINITSNIEEAKLCDYIIVYNHKDIVVEGPRDTVLKEEKLLKRLGFGLPFVVDLSTQLSYYGVVDKTYYDNGELVNDLWN